MWKDNDGPTGNDLCRRTARGLTTTRPGRLLVVQHHLQLTSRLLQSTCSVPHAEAMIVEYRFEYLPEHRCTCRPEITTDPMTNVRNLSTNCEGDDLW